MKYSACVFDLDGTLLDTLEDLKNSVNYTLKLKGYPQRTAEEVRSFVGNGIPMLIKRAVPEGTAETDFEEALSVFKGHYAIHLNDNTAPYDGICEMLEYLKQNNIKTAVVTNKAHLAANDLIKHFFGDLITVTVGQKDGVPTKPDPASLNSAMSVLNITKDEALFIGDSDVDVLTAHNGGLKCIGVTWGFRSKESLLSAGADFIADTPKEIIRILDNNS